MRLKSNKPAGDLISCDNLMVRPADRGCKPLRLMTNPKIIIIVIPAKAGTQCFQALLDPDFRRGDGLGAFSTVCAAASRSYKHYWTGRPETRMD